MAEQYFEWTDFDGDVKNRIESILSSLQVSSYFGRQLKGSGGLSGHLTVPGSQAIVEVANWCGLGEGLCKRALAFPDMHRRYSSYAFRCSHGLDHLFINAGPLRETANESIFDGEMMLYCYRLRNDRFKLRFSDASDWNEWINTFEFECSTSIEELLRQGKIFPVDRDGAIGSRDETDYPRVSIRLAAHS